MGGCVPPHRRAVEAVVNQHPAVLESAAVRVRSREGEDEVKVFVVLKDGQPLEPAELIDFLVPRMPRFMVPRYVEFAGALPKTATQRIEKGRLRDKGLNENTWDREKAGVFLSR